MLIVVGEYNDDDGDWKVTFVCVVVYCASEWVAESE